MDNLEKRINKEVDDRMAELSKFAVESEEYTQAVNNLQTLASVKPERDNRWLDILKTILPLGFYTFLTMIMLNFETTGTPTTHMFRNFLKFIKPNKL